MACEYGKIYYKDGLVENVVWYYQHDSNSIMFCNHYRRQYTFKNGTFYERVSVRDHFGMDQSDIFRADIIDHIVLDGETYRREECI